MSILPLVFFMQNMIDKHRQTYLYAKQWASQYYSDASIFHVEAFSNSVAYYVTGLSSGSGPSIREHVCSWALAGDGSLSFDSSLTVLFPDGRLLRPGHWPLSAALDFCAPICFGPLPLISLKVVQYECCFDDDPVDLDLIHQWELDELHSLLANSSLNPLSSSQSARLSFLSNKYLDS